MENKRIYLSSPTMHGEEFEYMKEAYDTNWMSTVGANIEAAEELTAQAAGCKYAVALASGTSALHLAIRLAGEELYGWQPAFRGTLAGHKVFCSDMTFDATANPIAYENGEAVFIDAEYDTWNLDPKALEFAFFRFPDVKLIVLAHLYGIPAKMDEIREVCKKHGALIVEDAAEALGAAYNGIKAGSLGASGVISFNGNKIITGSSGGAFVTDDKDAADKVRKWSTQARDNAPWYQHSSLGYNYRMSNVIAGVVRGQFAHLEEHIAQKKKIYERYKEGLSDLPLKMNPYDEKKSSPNYWLSCILIDNDAMCEQTRTDDTARFVPQSGKSCPTEIMETLASHNIESRPIWKPMHMQPLYRTHPFVTGQTACVDSDIFARGLCLPSDNKMTAEEQDRIIGIIHECFL